MAISFLSPEIQCDSANWTGTMIRDDFDGSAKLSDGVAHHMALRIGVDVRSNDTADLLRIAQALNQLQDDNYSNFRISESLREIGFSDIVVYTAPVDQSSITRISVCNTDQEGNLRVSSIWAGVNSAEIDETSGHEMWIIPPAA
jgi:hypothetical protein